MPPRPGAPVCKFWSRGHCNKGNNCDFQHPGSQAQSQNSFAALGQAGATRGRSGAFGAAGGGDKADLYNVSVANIRQDLNERSGDDPPGDRPLWPFSAYAPGREAPRQLLEGKFEQSPEELRVQYYLAQAGGRQQEYIQQEQGLLNEVKQKIQEILSNPEAAKQYILDGANVHPNRIDESQQKGDAPAAAQPVGGFGQPSGFGAAPAAGSAFGQPSGLGASKPAFGAPPAAGQSFAFGAPSALGGGAFGKPTALGGTTSAFGQTSSLGQSSPFGGAQKPTAFGQASQPAATGGFANPSGPAFGQSGFGAAAAKPAFGAPSQPGGAFGQSTQKPAFGQASQPGQSAFGQPSQPGQSAFGQASQPAAFGSPSPFGAAANKPSPFATAAQTQPQQSSNPFAAAANKPSPFAAAGQTQQPSSSPFSRPSGGFGSSTGGGGAFGAPSGNTQTNNSPFGAPAQQQQQQQQPPPQQSTGFGAASNRQQQTQTQWKGQPIVRDESGNPCTAVPAPTPKDPRRLDYTRIWFPDGPPSTQVNNPDALRDPEAPAKVYDGELGQVLKGLYEYAIKEGHFKEGVMPEVPPKREWIDFEI